MSEPFKKCNESCPLFGGENGKFHCYLGREGVFSVNRNDKCCKAMDLKEKRQYMKMQRELEGERDNITTKIYQLQLLIDNCRSE